MDLCVGAMYARRCLQIGCLPPQIDITVVNKVLCSGVLCFLYPLFKERAVTRVPVRGTVKAAALRTLSGIYGREEKWCVVSFSSARQTSWTAFCKNSNK